MLRNLKPGLLIIGIFFSCIHLFAQQNNLASTPPMGWNSYNCCGSAVHEDDVKANADYMAKNLKQFGWQYIVVDFLWSYDNPQGSTVGNPFQSRLPDGSYIPWLSMDQYGRLLPDVNKFQGIFKKKYVRMIHAHGCALLRLKVK